MAAQKDLEAGKKAAAVAAVNDWIKVGTSALHGIMDTRFYLCCYAGSVCVCARVCVS